VGFEYLVKKYRREAFYHAHSFLGNREDAADACQESFARAFMAIPSLQKLDAFYPWFYRILRNCCLNMLRRKKTVRRYSQEKKRDLQNVEAADPSKLVETQEKQALIWEVLNTLTPTFREILVLKYIQDKRYDEISELLNIPRGTVMSRLYHARKAFRDRYVAVRETEGSERKEVV
jgi:RNA polymerase sigma-70 factor (ECF subfamily)